MTSGTMPEERTAPTPGAVPVSPAQILEVVTRDPLGRGLLAGSGPAAHGRWDVGARLLCKLAVNLTGCDAATLDAAFRASPMMRPEWDAPIAEGTTFGEEVVRDAGATMPPKSATTEAGAVNGAMDVSAGDVLMDTAGPCYEPERIPDDVLDAMADGRAAATPAPRLAFVPLGSLTGPSTPTAPPMLVDGLLGRGETMLLSAPSKAGKSWLAISLAYAIATGSDWLGFSCHRGRVAYANLEVGGAFFARRCETYRVQAGLEYDPDISIDLLNARGLMLDAATFARGVESQYKDAGLDLLVVDCAYMLESGSENDVETVKPLLATLGSLCRSLGCSLVVIHHQAKYGASGKGVIDRMAGSGAFARWPDVIADLSPVDASGDEELSGQMAGQGYKALRLSFECRNVKSPEPVELLFTGTRFLRETSGRLAGCPLVGSSEAHGARGGRATSKATAATRARQTELVRSALEAARDAGEVPTRAFVLDYYNGHAAAHGLPEVTRATVTKWTQASYDAMPFSLIGGAVTYDGNADPEGS